MFSFTFCPIFQTKNRAFVDIFWIIFYFFGHLWGVRSTQWREGQSRCEKETRHQDCWSCTAGTQEGRTSVCPDVGWLRLYLSDKNSSSVKNNWDSYQFHKNYFQHICVPDPLLNSHALLHPLKQKKTSRKNNTPVQLLGYWVSAQLRQLLQALRPH